MLIAHCCIQIMQHTRSYLRSVGIQIDLDFRYPFRSGSSLLLCSKSQPGHGKQGRNRNFFLRGQSHFFPWFFPGVKSFFPVKNFHFGSPKTNFCRFEKWKAKDFSLLPVSIFRLPFYNFPSFPLHFPSPFSFFSLASLFLIDQQKFPSQKSLGGTLPPCPPPVTALMESPHWSEILDLRSHVRSPTDRGPALLAFEVKSRTF